MPVEVKMIEPGLLDLEPHLCRPLNTDEMELMTGLLIHQKNFPTDLQSHLISVPGIKVMVGRLEAVNVPVSFALAAFLSSLCDSFGKVSMWVYTLAWMCHRSNGEEQTLATWTGFFPMGVPTEEAYNLAWDAQKVERKFPKSDNAYDDIEYYPTLTR